LKSLALSAALLTASPAFAADPIIIEMQGDSTTAGTTGTKGNLRAAVHNEPVNLEAWLYQSNVTVVNMGRGGMTCYDRLMGTPTMAWAYPKNIWEEMRDSKATIVIFNYGLNDARYSVDFFESCIASLISIAKHYGKIVAIETPLSTNPTIAPYATAAANAASDGGAHLIDHATLMDHQFPDWRDHLPDGIHPDEELYIQKAAIAYIVLNPIISDLQAGK
jgi:lysophospholipase L1-like esterase